MNIDKSKLDLAMAKECCTAEKLAKLTGVSQVTLARIKRGAQEPRPATVGKIAKALKVRVEELIVFDEKE